MSNPLMEAVDLRKTYRMGRVGVEVLRGCSLAIGSGEFLAIMGKSGSGKSTLLHLLGALDVPNQGQVTFHDKPIYAPPTQRRFRPGVLDTFSFWEQSRIRLRRHAFGFVFQFYHLLPELTVLENVLLTRMIGTPWLRWGSRRKKYDERARSIIERVGLTARIKHRPNELSGGERQRVAIARALIHDPQILFADEPTGNLDEDSGGRILELLTGLHGEGQTIVMVTHDASVARAADRTLHLDRGVLATN